MKLAMTSCETGPAPFWAASSALKLGAHHFVMGGDDPYYNSGATRLGYTTSQVSTTSTTTDVQNLVHQMFRKRGWSDLKTAMDAGTIKVSWAGGDDHRWADSCDHTVESALLTSTGASTQALVNSMAQVWYTAHRSLGNTYWNYPTSASLNSNNGDIPAACFRESQVPSASWFPVIYHYVDWGIGGVLGGTDIRVIVPDLITYRDPLVDTDDTSKELWGPVQEAWIENAITTAWESGFKYIVIASSKKRFDSGTSGRYGSGANSDVLNKYSAKFDGLMNRLDAKGINGIIMLSGDRHTPQVNLAVKGVNGDTYNLLDVCGCPSGVEHNATGQQLPAQSLYTRSAPDKIGKGFNVFNYVEFTPDFAHIKMLDAVSQGVRWECKVRPRSCTPLYL